MEKTCLAVFIGASILAWSNQVQSKSTYIVLNVNYENVDFDANYIADGIRIAKFGAGCEHTLDSQFKLAGLINYGLPSNNVDNDSSYYQGTSKVEEYLQFELKLSYQINSGMYVFIDPTITQLEVSSNGKTSSGTDYQAEDKATSLGYSAGLGYRWNEHIAVEGKYGALFTDANVLSFGFNYLF